MVENWIGISYPVTKPNKGGFDETLGKIQRWVSVRTVLDCRRKKAIESSFDFSEVRSAKHY